MKLTGDLQEMLSLGYIYLLLLGITSDTIYYSMIGINILSFSDVLDVMISPFVHLTRSLAFPTVIALIIVAGYFYRRKMNVIIEKRAHMKMSEDKSIEAVRDNQAWLGFTALAIFAAYVGLAVGGGMSLRDKIQSGQIKPDHRITFETGETKDVKLIGNNSAYLFYLPIGEKLPIISPIGDHMKHLQQLPDEE